MSDPNALVSALTRDDAAVYRLSGDRAIVVTVDFFAPIVDDAYAFGAIAAANAFSDLYAMGAAPLLALNIVAWPRAPEMLQLLGDTVRGALDVARQAGAPVLGGHSIDDPEPKFGMVALGDVHPDRILTNAGARPGDRLVLTKPVGTGILSTALKGGMITERDMERAVRSMTTLNVGALRAVRALDGAAHAVTDVTGFGLVGHLRNVLAASAAAARLWASRVPEFSGVQELIARGAVPGGTVRNQEAAADYTSWSTDVEPVVRTLLCDAQTSGGLLVAVAPDQCAALIEALRKEGTPAAAEIGVVTEGNGTVDVHLAAD